MAWTVLPKVSCMVCYTDSTTQRHIVAPVWAIFSTPPNQTAANTGELEKGLNSLADKLKGLAAGGDDIKKYASGNLTYGPGSRALYGSIQCTPHMDKDMCMKCLSDATKEVHNCCSKTRALTGVVFSGNCFYWYSHFNFLA
ncbi:hypothetical protein L1987_07380 [Smallanthus sonchifolius]|uniref:Uncharacterized protein n=1 Tax=Smallanthus sonchifolius TaxID=185202 RepID=A0ACB9K0K2_9ASTR|nr:hypothetical protein L1987_07380 [Smallanthus sonchifolius]